MEGLDESKDMRTATFYPTPYGSMLATHTYEMTRRHIEAGYDIDTTQMCLLNKVKDYDLIRIVSSKDDVIEIRNNHDGTYSCDRTDRELRRIHSFLHMWENGVFE
jgi:hypothetical protein